MQLSAWHGSLVSKFLLRKSETISRTMNCCQWNRSNLRIKPESRTRGLAKGQLAIVIISLICGIRRARAQSAIERLQPLVEISARRLAIAEQVALVKWRDGAVGRAHRPYTRAFYGHPRRIHQI